MNWRKWNNIIHRDIGYLCVGLTLIYAVSGIAVNHNQDWNPNFKREISEYSIGTLSEEQRNSKNLPEIILHKIGCESSYKDTFIPENDKLQIFIEGGIVNVDFNTGVVFKELISERKFFKFINDLHLNKPKKLWTVLADIYAVFLGLLAITGLFVLKGKKGIKGRGAWLTGAGIVIPIMVLYFLS